MRWRSARIEIEPPPREGTGSMPYLEKNNLPTSCDFSAQELYKASLSDKKRSLDTMSVIVPEKLGLCKIVKLPVEHLENFIQKGMN